MKMMVDLRMTVMTKVIALVILLLVMFIGNLSYKFFFFLEPKTERDDLINPYWIEDKDLKRGEVDYLSGPEIQFWKDLLDKYLYPIDENKEQQVRVFFLFHFMMCPCNSFSYQFLN
jgi:hypothetical protein